MSEQGSPDEATLLTAVARLLREIDPVPEAVLDAGEAAGAWIPASEQPPPDPLVELDGMMVASGLRATHALPDMPRVFRNTGTTVRLGCVSAPGGGTRFSGIVTPAGGAAFVEIHGGAGIRRCAVDSAGRFTASGPAPGPARLVVAGLDGTRLATAWFLP